jgi:autotransporter-associated beta strand protein
MKPKFKPFRHSVAGAIFIAATFSLTNHSQAASGDWNVDADGFWNTASNWNPVAVPGTTAGDIVNLTYNITTAGKTITIDTAVRLGTLNIGDPDGSHLYTLALTSGSLTFDNGASAAQLTKTPGFNAATLSAPAALDSNLIVSNLTNGNLNLNGVISNGVDGAKSVTISNSGTGITILSGANTFSGGLIIHQGTVSGTTSANAFGSGSISLGDTSGSANATLRSVGNLTFTNPIVVQSGSSGNTLTILGSGGGGSTATFSGGIALNRDLSLDSTDGTLIMSTGLGAVTGSGTLSITNSSATPNLRSHRVAHNASSPSFTGDLDILTNGTLRVGNATALSVANDVKVRSGGLLEMNALFTIGGLNDEAGSGGLVSTIGGNRTLTLGGSDSYSFNGAIEDYFQPGTPGNLRKLSLVKSGAGTQALGGTNAYTGDTTLNGGLLKLNSANALPGGIGTTGGTSALLFKDGGVIGLTAASGDFTRAIQGLTPGVDKVGWTNAGQGGFAAFGGDRSVNFGGNADTIVWTPPSGILGSALILGHSSADSKVTVVNPINLNFNTRTVFVNDGSAPVDAELAGLITGSGALNKDGTGTLDLIANNTYGAATNVLAGTLRIKGLQNGDTSTVTISSGATLVLESTGQLTFKPTTNGVSNKITGDGTAILNGTLLIKPAAADLTNGNSWTIVDAVGATSNLAAVASFPALTWTESPSGVWKAVDGSKTWTYTESSGTLGLAVSASVTYESWAIANGISGAAFTDDSDNDGIDNGTEYAIGGNPTSFTAPAALVSAGADFTLTYAKGTDAAADPQIDYLFETSPDLDDWTEVAPTTENTSSVSYTLVKSGLKKFVRLKIVRTTP